MSTIRQKYSILNMSIDVKTRVCPRFFVQVGHETMYASSGNKHLFSKSTAGQTLDFITDP